MEEQAKLKKPANRYTFKPGQSGNLAGRPKKFLSIEELTVFVKARSTKVFSEYFVSGKIWSDLDQMSPTKRFENMMNIYRSLVPQEGGQPQDNQPMKIEVVFGKKEEAQTIELKPKSTETDTYE